jgi:hypothetical protein
MKKKILLLIAVATLGFTAATKAQVPNYVPTNGLVGYWPFNGNANDESGNGNNGTVNGATLTSDRFGNANKAYNFDGINDLIQINTIGSSTFDNNFSISIWCSFSAFNNDYLHLIFGENNFITLSGNGPAYAGAGEANKISAYQNSINPPTRRIPYFSTNTTFMDSAYYHIVFIKNGATAFLYLNGILESTIPVDNSLSIPVGNYIQIGSGLNNISNNCMNGKIDDIGIWNRALTQQEITALYNGNICYQTITVTDTLLINMGITGFNPVTFNNTIKIFPNPTNDHITIDYGNFAMMNGYQIKITNSLGQQMFQTPINQQSNYVSLASWGGNGLYFVYIIDPQGNTLDIRKIVLQ